MPIYDYQCDDCGHLFEVIKKRSAPEPAECPDCGAADPRRAISATAFQLKGTGWYVTDYKSPTKGTTKSPEGSEASGSKSESKSGDTKSDSATDTSSSGSDSSEPGPASQDVA